MPEVYGFRALDARDVCTGPGHLARFIYTGFTRITTPSPYPTALKYVPGTSTLGMYQRNALRVVASLLTPPTRTDGRGGFQFPHPRASACGPLPVAHVAVRRVACAQVRHPTGLGLPRPMTLCFNSANPRVERGLDSANPRVECGLDSANPRVERGLDSANPRVECGLDSANPRVERGLDSATPRVERGLDSANPHVKLGLDTVDPLANLLLLHDLV
eukprot:scaffold24368_cov63-Phaeocystis_antarctica.AAC.1